MNRYLIYVWENYKDIARYIGDFQARVLLTMFYFTMAVPFAVVTRLLADPLRINKIPTISGWTKRLPVDNDLPSVNRQF